MAGFQNILIAVDLSEGSRQAILHGSHLAKRSQGNVHLLNVVTDPGLYLSDASVPVIIPPTFLTEVRDAAEQGLAKLLTGDEARTFKVSREVIIDSPAEGIVRIARQRQSDLICIGTHGRSGLARLALGSIAERVVQRAPCPVLVGRSGKEGERNLFRRIAVAIDFSEFSPGLLQLARQVAGTEPVTLDLLHVVEEYPLNRSEFSADEPFVQDDLNARRSDAEKRLAALDVPEATVARRVLLGRPFVEINQYAAENQIDLIIVGTHGRTGLRHWFLGSVAEMIVRKSPCSVLVMPRRETSSTANRSAS